MAHASTAQETGTYPLRKPPQISPIFISDKVTLRLCDGPSIFVALFPIDRDHAVGLG